MLMHSVISLFRLCPRVLILISLTSPCIILHSSGRSLLLIRYCIAEILDRCKFSYILYDGYPHKNKFYERFCIRNFNHITFEHGQSPYTLIEQWFCTGTSSL